MARRSVAAAIVGGNGNMAETFAAIWEEVNTQSRALLPLLRLTALRAMKFRNVGNGNGKALFTEAHYSTARGGKFRSSNCLPGNASGS